MKNKHQIKGEVTFISVKVGARNIIKTMIDTCDLEKAKRMPGTWCASYSRKTKSYYIQGWMPGPYKGRERGMTVGLARFLFDEVPEDMVIDHTNHDTLDNRRSANLRIVTETENRHNRKAETEPKRRREAFYAESII